MAYTKYCRVKLGGGPGLRSPPGGERRLHDHGPGSNLDPYPMFPIPANHIIGMQGEDDFAPNYSAQVWTITNNGAEHAAADAQRRTSLRHRHNHVRWLGHDECDGGGGRDRPHPEHQPDGLPIPKLLKRVKIKAGDTPRSYTFTPAGHAHRREQRPALLFDLLAHGGGTERPHVEPDDEGGYRHHSDGEPERHQQGDL